MLGIFESPMGEHDLRIFVLAVLICFFASSTAIIMAQRALAAEDSKRMHWLLAAGTVTGIGIWTTDFAEMLAFESGAQLRFDPRFTLAAVIWAVAFAIAGWVSGFRSNRRRPVVGGLLIGISLAGSHFLDTFSIQFAGTVTFKMDLVVLSLLAGFPLCVIATCLFSRHAKPGIPIPASLALAAGIMVMHLTAMAAVTLIADPGIVMPQAGLGLNTLGGLVMGAAVSILAAGFALGVYDHRSAAIVADDRRRLRESLAALHQSREHYRSTLELNPQIPWTTDPDGYCLEVGSNWTEFFGLELAAALGSGWLSIIHSEDRPRVEADWRTALTSGDPHDARFRMRCHDGIYRWFRDRGKPWRDRDGAITAWYGSLENIHEQVIAEDALRESEERYRLASRATDDAIWDWQHATERVDWGGAIGSHFGYHEGEKGTSLSWWAERVHADDRDMVIASLRTALAGDDIHWSREYRFLKADGTYAHVLSRGYIVRQENGEPIRTIGAMMDISEHKEKEFSLRWAAQHDPLTQLPNRLLFHTRLADALTDAKNSETEVALVILDVDHFKLFNDSRGHSAGDKLLCWIASRLQSLFPPNATVARLGGDEFAIIMPDYQEFVGGTALAALRGPVTIEDEQVDVAVSAGLAVWPRDASEVHELLKCADLALYACKEKRNGIRRFHPTMREAFKKRARMIELASLALREDCIWPHYQPKVCLKTGALIGLEALLRWQHPSEGLQSPASIAAAFDTPDLAVKITDRILDCVLADINRWRDQGLEFGRVAVNATPADFMRGDFAKRLLGRLEIAGVSPQHIELEVTENVLVGGDAERVGAMLRNLSQSGMTIALDDFGTGYASLSHLNSFPVDVLKIDQSFVQRLSDCESARDEAIVRAIIGLARNMRILTVAEGVETTSHAARLQTLRCDIAQGYLFSRPLAASQVPSLIIQGLLQWPALVRQQRREQRGRAKRERAA